MTVHDELKQALERAIIAEEKLAMIRSKFGLWNDEIGNMTDTRHPGCDHDWKDVDSQSDDTVKCRKCGVYGSRQPDGSIYWPAT